MGTHTAGQDINLENTSRGIESKIQQTSDGLLIF
jgi:hypothetical protein